jgi:hypothetical protein
MNAEHWLRRGTDAAGEIYVELPTAVLHFIIFSSAVDVARYEKLDAETRALVPLRRLYWSAKVVAVPARLGAPPER